MTTFMDMDVYHMNSFESMRSVTLAMLWGVFLYAAIGFFKIMLDGLPSHDDVLNPTL